MFSDLYKDKRVLVTGHTGFKGAWLVTWLEMLGAEVDGFALQAVKGSLFDKLSSHMGRLVDIRDPYQVFAKVDSCQPDMVFHLAAQPIVRTSYEHPVLTYQTNVMGTLNLLEALRRRGKPCSIVVVTSDKCYENVVAPVPCRESDRLGGFDPYSSSKACAEILCASYRRSFLNALDIRLATARAGNVVGGGDMAEHRLVPDCIRALRKGEPIRIRNRNSRRSWQHVLSALSGYLTLGAALLKDDDCSGAVSAPENGGHRPPLHKAPANGGHRPPLQDNSVREAFNFSGTPDSHRSVGELVAEVLKHWPGECVDDTSENAPHEDVHLNLSSDKAFHRLNWRSAWDFEETIARTVAFYKRMETEPCVDLMREQIQAYQDSSK